MGFYEELSRYYDIVFPTGEAQIKFITKRAKGKKTILDLAAGTGNYSIALGKQGYDVTAVDLDKEMVNKIYEKNKLENTKVKALVMDMRDIDNVQGKFDVVVCIGNSLVHLDNKEEIENLIKKLYSILNQQGVLILQIVNYDRILKYNIKELPLIEREDLGVKFIRNYQKADNKILFKTRLSVKNKDKEEEYENTVELFPIESKDLNDILINTGFRDVEFYGDFNEGAYEVNSMSTVIAAYK